MRHSLGAQPARGAAREKIGGVERQKHFGEDCFDARLSCFASDHVDDFFAARRRSHRADRAAWCSVREADARPNPFARCGRVRR